jgi:hypothetical protein
MDSSVVSALDREPPENCAVLRGFSI